ncbi:SAICAR synthase-like protein [Sistotremastrum suecicum HHB10207 ss-3]|uniref:Kinase n=1 Tax=Sistotremastrum suecicum HHB10207 ss-3 TaxID=1314776 RepID=A0A165YX35_9AGAM|nr:SAICAR synthase-like protein [Sistotremastrum suecicum HHB10207 ss-3]
MVQAPRPLAFQVGGHGGIVVSQDGTLVIKPCLPNEPKFYQTVQSEPSLAPLKDIIPAYFIDAGNDPITGVHRARGRTEADGTIVLENLTHGFRHPNVIDIKLGTIIHDEFTSPEKRARSEEKARAQTSWETGLTLTGFSLYNPSTDAIAITRREDLRKLKAAELPRAIQLCFPTATQTGPYPSSNSQSHSKTQEFIDLSAPPRASGLPPSLLHEVIRKICDETKHIRNVLANSEISLIGASLLIVYETDWEACRQGLEYTLPGNITKTSAKAAQSFDDEADRSVRRSYNADRQGACLVKLIDFAHTRYTPGRYVHDGVLMGLDNILNLFEGRIEELEDLDDDLMDTTKAQSSVLDEGPSQ